MKNLLKAWDILNERLEETTIQEDRNLIIKQMNEIKQQILKGEQK